MSKVVKENRFSKVIEGISMFFTALTVNDTIAPEELEVQAEKIREQENKGAIEKLEKSTTSVNIPLKDVVEKAEVNETLAMEKAKEVKSKNKSIEQKQIGE